MEKTFRVVMLLFLLSLFWHLGGGTTTIFAQNVPNGAIDGINYIDNNTVVLVLTAPNKVSAYVTGTFNSWGQTNMNKTPDGKKFWVQLNGLTAGQEYIYQYVVDGIRIADPYTEKVLDPWNDPYISSSTYPGLISWTDTGKGIAGVFQTAQPEYNWQVQNFDAPDDHKLIVYELLIRDFTAEHSYKSVIDSIQYLKNLGINAIELLPVNEFEGNTSWGYNPSFTLLQTNIMDLKVNCNDWLM
jgi:1,4-alpha-glucan branching enzyme